MLSEDSTGLVVEVSPGIFVDKPGLCSRNFRRCHIELPLRLSLLLKLKISLTSWLVAYQIPCPSQRNSSFQEIYVLITFCLFISP